MSLLSAPRDANWIGCVDFGTALSKVAVVRTVDQAKLRPDDCRPLALVTRGHSPYLLPSIVFVTESHLLFGQEAADAAIRAEGSMRRAFVSPKQYLSTHDREDLDQLLPADIEPSGRFSARDLLRMYMAYLLNCAGNDAKKRRLPWPVPLRVARPAWQEQRAEHGEQTLKEIVRDGFELVDKLGSKLSRSGGVPHRVALQALRALTRMTRQEERRIFKLSSNGLASVLEATAVAAGTIRQTGRRVVAVADVGAGTSDFGAFMTGLPGYNVVGELDGSSRVLREAGDHLDMLLRRYILAKAGYLPDDPAARGASNRLLARARPNKERLFSGGTLTVEVGDELLDITVTEFLADSFVVAFARRLSDEFHQTLTIAVQRAESYSPRGGQTPVEILLTGGGHTLPMVRALLENPSIPWLYTEAAPDLVERPEDLDFHSIRRQIVVAIGGAVRDLPVQTAPVHD